VNVGGIFSAAYFFDKYVGAQAEFGLHEYGGSGETSNNDGFTTISGGLIFRYPTADSLLRSRTGGWRADWRPGHEPNTWGPALTVGGGMDYNTPLFGGKLAIRLFQADYEYMHADFGPKVFGGRANINAAR